MVLYDVESDGTSNRYGKDIERAIVEARPQLEKEALDLERAVSDVAIEVYSHMKFSAKYSQVLLTSSINFLNVLHVCFRVVQTKEVEERIAHFEECDLQMEKEWQQLMQLKNLIFIDQLTLLLNKASAPKTGETIGEEVIDVKAE